MEEQEKREEHEELTRKRRTEKESLKEKQTLKCQLNKEGVQRKRNRREKCKINGQNVRRKTEKNLRVERILTVHVALNWSNINSSLMCITRNMKRLTNMFSSYLIDKNSNMGATNELEIYDHH